MRRYDVTALGELLLILRKMDIAAREILYLRLIPGERRAMFLPCWQNWDILPPLSEKSAGTVSGISCSLPSGRREFQQNIC